MKAHFLIAGLILFSFALLHASDDRKPNIIIIFSDDLGYGDLGCYGHPTIRTPELDKMAREGLKLTQFYSASPVCSPSRASLLTGRYPIKNGVTRVFFPYHNEGLAPEEITIAEELRNLDYHTACIGKWHLGHKEEFLPINQGFDSYYGVPYSNDMTIDPAMKLSEHIVLRMDMTKEMILNINDLEIENKNHLTPLMENDEVIEFPADQETLTKRYTEKALDFIEENKDDPFFLYLPYTMPHIPLFASEDFQDVSQRGLYGDVIEEIDWSVGQILDRLKQLNIDENTLVIFTSDNGPWLTKGLEGGSSGLLHEGKFTTWEGGVRVPTICWWPGQIQPSTVSSELTATLDLFPTLVKLAGGDFSGHDIDGYDISPVLFDSGVSPRSEMAYYSDERLYAYREKAWKIHFYTKSPAAKKWQGEKHEPPLLYNIEHDPSEQYNLNQSHPEVVQALIQKAVKFRNSPEHVDITIEVVDGTLGYEKIMITGSINGAGTPVQMYDDGSNDDKTADDHIWTKTISQIPVNSQYEWSLVEDGGSAVEFSLIASDPLQLKVDEDGNITGSTKYIIKGSGPDQVDITFTVTDETKSFKKIMIKGTMYENWTSLDMYDDGSHDDKVAGDHTWTRTIRDIPIGATYRWGCSEDDSIKGDIWLVKGTNLNFTLGADGKITGKSDYIIPLDGE